MSHSHTIRKWSADSSGEWFSTLKIIIHETSEAFFNETWQRCEEEHGAVRQRLQGENAEGDTTDVSFSKSIYFFVGDKVLFHEAGTVDC